MGPKLIQNNQKGQSFKQYLVSQSRVERQEAQGKKTVERGAGDLEELSK